MNKDKAIEKIRDLRKDEMKSWPELAKEYKRLTGEALSGDSLRKRVARLPYLTKKDGWVCDTEDIVIDEDFQPDDSKEYIDADFNRIKLFKKAYFDADTKKTPENILKALGYDPQLFKLGKYTLSNWDVPAKDVNKDCFAIKAVILPKGETDLTADDYVKLANEALSGSIPKHGKIKCVPDNAKGRDRFNCFEKFAEGSKLVEIPPIELHYGRLANDISSHTTYDLNKAEEYFYEIFNRIVDHQKKEWADECLLVIGSDFFNSESTSATTRGTPQHNAADFKKMFIGGVQMYKDAIEMLAEVFPVVNVMLCAGNHARAMEFFMYCALKEHFADCKNISFKEDYTPTQAFVFGNVGLFYNHGDTNQKRTIASIAAEFPKEWGATKFRELHMGHLHCEKVVDENAGLITRRIGAPCEADEWSYLERFIGAVKKHQTFTWDSINGLCSINYINL
jgi:hypothetical protein